MRATSDYESLHHLTTQQAVAAHALVTGATQEEAAQAAGVHRVTVTRWANHHPAFIAEVNRARAELVHQTQASVARLTDLALAVVESALKDGNLDTALRWLRMVPFPPPAAAVGSIDTEEIVEQVRLAMPSPLDEMSCLTDTRTTEDAERAIAARLAAPEPSIVRPSGLG